VEVRIMIPSRARRSPRVLLVAWVVAFALAEWPLLAAGPPDQPSPGVQSPGPACVGQCEALAWAAQQAFTGIDVEALVDEALRAVMTAGENIEVGDIVKQAIEEARVQAALRALPSTVEAGRLREEIERALAEADFQGALREALEAARLEVDAEVLDRLVEDALADVDIEGLLRRALDAALFPTSAQPPS
jgi:hypothetical protein